MILDLLENASCYTAACEGFAEAFAFLERPDLGELPVDTYQIDGDRIYAMVARPHAKRVRRNVRQINVC